MADAQLPLLLSLSPNRVRRNYLGGAQLDALEGRPNPVDGHRPEDWIASTVSAQNPGLPPIPGEGLARARLPDGRDILVRDLFQAHPEHYLGRPHFENLGPNLGFLVKLLDSAMRLHVQAHPTADFARRRLNSRWGKLETYVILGVRLAEKGGGDLSDGVPDPFFRAPPSGATGYIRLGFQRPPSPAEWRRIVLAQDIPAMDACFDPVPVRPGEVWVVPGGLPHAIGEGLLVLEVMEPTDLVVRCEFTRAAPDGELVEVPPPARFMGRDPDFALAIFDHAAVPVEEVRRRYCVPPRVLRAEPLVREEQLIGPKETECFAVTRVEAKAPAGVALPPQVHVGVVEAGSGTVSTRRERKAVRRGSRFLIAAAAGTLTLAPDPAGDLTLLLCRPGRT